MSNAKTLPSFRPSTIILVMLSLSIGWGIRGNFGHEFGAMIAGTLAGIAVCLFSGRDDWRQRVPYFAFFGALGWAFGGSVAYMPMICYAQSGHLPTQIYGWFTAFMVGFLWASLGGAGTAYPAVETREKLTQIFRPLAWVFVLWTVQYFCEDYMEGWYLKFMNVTGVDQTDFRQNNPFYWLDSEWLECTTALIALCAFDLWDRRFKKLPMLIAFGACGALAGWLLQHALDAAGLLGPIVGALVHYQVDPAALDPTTGQPFGAENLLTNWPQLFSDLGRHLGWIFGAIAGAAVYFKRYGAWRSGSSLLMHLTLGSYLTFLIGPVLLTNLFTGVGGFRMTPPRGDSWANTLGVLIGLCIYMYRNKQTSVVLAALLSGTIGGLGMMVAEMLKILAFVPGNPVLNSDPATVQYWAHWHGSNWHSICTEQGVGLFYGLAIAITIGLLASRVKPVDNGEPARRWTEAFSVSFILNALLYVNLVKNIEDWTRVRTGGHRAVPEMMKAPWFQSIELSAWTWFTLMFLLMTLVTVALLAIHLRRPIAVVPSTWLGKGQLFFLVFLWAIVLGNFEKAVVGFAEQRLATEGTIMVNALIVTFMILALAKPSEAIAVIEPPSYGPMIRKTIALCVALFLLLTASFTLLDRSIYGDKFDGWGGRNLRFGPQADWLVKPILKNKAHR